MAKTENGAKSFFALGALVMNLQIKRDLVDVNWNELADLYWEGMVAEVLGIGRPVGQAWEKFAAENRQELERSDHVAIAYVDQRCVGAVHALSDGVRDAAIFGLVVHPQFRRRGIATRLVEALLADLGFVSIMVRSNEASEPIFTKFGFRTLNHVMALRHNESAYRQIPTASEPFLRAARHGGLTSSPEIWGPGGLELSEAIADTMNLPVNSLVIDLGAGSGETSCFLAEEYGWRLLAVEHWGGLEALRKIQTKVDARGLFGKVIPMNGDARDLRLADGCVDGIFCQGTFEMIADDRPKAIAQMKRVVRPGGVIGIGEPIWNVEPTAEIAQEIYGNPTGAEFLKCFRTLQWTTDLLRQHELHVTHQEISAHGERWWEDYYSGWIDTDGKANRSGQQEEIDIWKKDSGKCQGIGIITAAHPGSL